MRARERGSGKDRFREKDGLEKRERGRVCV